MPNPPEHDGVRAPDLLTNELRQQLEDATAQLRDRSDQEFRRLRVVAEEAEETRNNIAEMEMTASGMLDTIRELQIGASRSALIGSHSDTARLERQAQERWRLVTMLLWVSLIAVAALAAMLTVLFPPTSWTWQYLLTRGPAGALFITLGLAIRYTSNRAEDHRIQELVMTNVALSIRSAEGFAKAIEDAVITSSDSEYQSRDFLTGISKTLFVSPIDALLRRGDAKWNRRPRSMLLTEAEG